MQYSQMNALSLEQVVARRKGRIAFGKALMVGGISFWNMAWIAQLLPEKARFASIGLALAAAWVLAIGIGLAASLRSKLKGKGRLVPVFSSADALRQQAESLSQRSLAWPLVSLSLLVPISLHFLVALPFGENEFEVWMVMSLALSGVAHFALIAMAWVFAQQKHKLPSKVRGISFGLMAWLVSIGGGMIPGVVLYFIPVILVAVSGVFIPFAFSYFAMRWEKEHQALV